MRLSKKQKARVQKLSWVLFILYIGAMCYFLFFSEYLNRSPGDIGEYRYNLVLFQEIGRAFWCLRNNMASYFLLNVVMNIAAFMPFGFILPIISNRKQKLGQIFLLSFELTLSVEIMQLVMKVGIFDVDDIFLNTLGGILGYLMFLLFRWAGKGKVMFFLVKKANRIRKKYKK